MEYRAGSFFKSSLLISNQQVWRGIAQRLLKIIAKFSQIQLFGAAYKTGNFKAGIIEGTKALMCKIGQSEFRKHLVYTSQYARSYKDPSADRLQNKRVYMQPRLVFTLRYVEIFYGFSVEGYLAWVQLAMCFFDSFFKTASTTWLDSKNRHRWHRCMAGFRRADHS